MSEVAIVKSGRHRDGLDITIDKADLPLVEGMRWSISTKHGSLTRYAFTRTGGKARYLHRLITNAPDGMDVDHIDGNGLNNCRDNLRVTSRAENIKSAYGLAGHYQKPRKAVVLNTIRRTLADGTVRVYVYDRVTGKRVSVNETKPEPAKRPAK